MDQPRPRSRRERIAQERQTASRPLIRAAEPAAVQDDPASPPTQPMPADPAPGHAPAAPQRPPHHSAQNQSAPHWSAPQHSVQHGAPAEVHEPRPRQAPQKEPLGPLRAAVRGFGELCITSGLILILFVVWQLWWTDIEANQDNAHLAGELSTEWAKNPDNELPPDPDTPVIAEPVDMNTAFGIMYIPRFGDDYFRTIAEGVSLEPVLNRMGLGRYPNAAMPGEVGNFAVAGHRVTYGKPLNLIAELRPGDEIIVQTADGFYTYSFRNFDIVLPDAIEVIAPVPSQPEYRGKDRILTLTACNPMFSARERYIAYAVLTDWRPAAEGAPDSIRDSEGFITATGGEG